MKIETIETKVENLWDVKSQVVKGLLEKCPTYDETVRRVYDLIENELYIMGITSNVIKRVELPLTDIARKAVAIVTHNIIHRLPAKRFPEMEDNQ